MPCLEKIERNEEIFLMIEAGVSYKKVAGEFGISTSRVVQIYNSMVRKKIYGYLKKIC